MTTFRCRSCDREHDLAEVSFGADAPVQWNLISEIERSGSELSSDQCIIEARGDEERTSFYIRGCLDVPIRGTERCFTWGVWVSVSERSFEEIADHWDDPRRTELGPYFGWLCTKVPGYPDTMFLKTSVRQRGLGERPLIGLEPTDHPLAVDQQVGVDPKFLGELVQSLIHPDPSQT